jgi:hypothetical protein
VSSKKSFRIAYHILQIILGKQVLSEEGSVLKIFRTVSSDEALPAA